MRVCIVCVCALVVLCVCVCVCVCACRFVILLQVDSTIENHHKGVSNKDARQNCLLCGERSSLVVPSGRDKLTLHAAGVQCKDVTVMGSMQGDSGKCMPSQSVWLQERGKYEEDVIMNECTVLWDPRLLASRLGQLYNVISFELDGNAHMGDLIVRTRRLTTGFNQEKCYLIADPRGFVDIFGRQCVASPELLWWADANDESVEFPSSSAALEVNEDAEFDWTETLTLYQRYRLLDYERYTRSLVADAKVLDTDMHMYDLDRNCPIGYKGSTCAEDPHPLRTLISHGTIWNSRLRWPLLACEWLVAHGVPGVQGRFWPRGSSRHDRDDGVWRDYTLTDEEHGRQRMAFAISGLMADVDSVFDQKVRQGVAILYSFNHGAR